jgi:hypothetical protein
MVKRDDATGGTRLADLARHGRPGAEGETLPHSVRHVLEHADTERRIAEALLMLRVRYRRRQVCRDGRRFGGPNFP